MSETTIISGLRTCKPKNAPVVGQIQAFVIENRGDWNKIKNPGKKNGEVGVNYRIVKATKTDYSDAHGNISFDVELERVFGNAPLSKPESPDEEYRHDAPPASQDARGDVPNGEDGIKVTKAHLARSANLYNLVVDAAVTLICPHIPKEQRTNEQFQSIVGQLFREVYTKRTDDGVNWYSYVDKMPIKPLKEAQPDEEKDIPF